MVQSIAYGSVKKAAGDFETVVTRVREELQKEGFGVLSEIDVQATLKKKLDVDMPRYLILGACNPPFAHKAIQNEEHIGLMLPCNVLVRESGDGVEVSVIDPVASMQSVGNRELEGIASEVRDKLNRALAAV